MAGDPILARVLRHHGGKLLNEAVDRLLPEVKPVKPSFTRKIASFALLRVATRSVPGAILVGGGLVAKRLHERHKAKKAAEAAAPASMAKKPAPKKK